MREKEMANLDKLLENSTILVTGGTGSFGNDFVDKVVKDYLFKEIRIFSRDEKKQFDMRNRLKNPKIKFFIGDVRDRESVFKVMKDVDFVFHAAALKQVPTCEFFPLEAIKTNIFGTSNVLDAAVEAGVRKVVILSTDKAVYPINAMGMTKALLEKLMIAKARNSNNKNVFCGVRYGNVLYSRGSVLPLFANQIQNSQPLTVTNPEMTRFLLPLPVAINLVLHAIEKGENGDMFVRKSPAATIGTIAQAMLNIFESNVGIKVIGIRSGEKMHETLVTREELMKAEEDRDFYRIRNFEKLDYDKYFTKGKIDHIPEEGYTSKNTIRLTLDRTQELILSLKEIQELLKWKRSK
ncbi:MAG: polysaccharide biosynthesis protein [Candidatus Helarchaeota archaeon]